MLIQRLQTRAFASRLIGSKYGGLQLLGRGKNLTAELLLSREASSSRISKNIKLLTQEPKPKPLVGHQPLTFPQSATKTERVETNGESDKEKNLVAMFTWLESKPKHVMKYANLYLNQGFDVVTVSINPLQLLWPKSGSKSCKLQVRLGSPHKKIGHSLIGLRALGHVDNVRQTLIAQDAQREYYQKILLHGFSVGGYLWGEALNLMENDRQKYESVNKRIVGQVWDSIADATEISIGVPRAMFPNRIWLQGFLKNSLEFHMWFFHEQSTRHYLLSKQAFHRSVVRAPALYFLSKTDPVGTVNSNLELTDAWKSIGIETTIKIFESSPHVSHFLVYPEEYTAELYGFLAKLNLLRNDECLVPHRVSNDAPKR